MFLLLRNIICCFLLASSSAIMCMIHHSWRRWCSHGVSALHHNIPDKVSLRVEWFISAYNFRDFNSWWFNFNISGTTVRGGITMDKIAHFMVYKEAHRKRKRDPNVPFRSMAPPTWLAPTSSRCHHLCIAHHQLKNDQALNIKSKPQHIVLKPFFIIILKC